MTFWHDFSAKVRVATQKGNSVIYVGKFGPAMHLIRTVQWPTPLKWVWVVSVPLASLHSLQVLQRARLLSLLPYHVGKHTQCPMSAT